MNVMIRYASSLMILLALITAIAMSYTDIVVINNSSYDIEIHTGSRIFKIEAWKNLELRIPKNESTLKIVVNNRSYVLPINMSVSRLYLFLSSKDKIFYAFLTSSNINIIEDIKYKLVEYPVGSGMILSIMFAEEIVVDAKIINVTYCTITKCVDVSALSSIKVRGNEIVVAVNVEKGRLPFMDIANNSVSLILNTSKSDYLVLLYSKLLSEKPSTSTTSTMATPSTEHISTRLFTFIATNMQSNDHESNVLNHLTKSLRVESGTLEDLLLLITTLILGISIYLNIRLRKSER